MRYKLQIADGIDKEEMRAVIEEAMSHFPELNEIKIEFLYRKINSTMMATVKYRSALRQGSRRVYRVYYNPTGGGKKGVSLKDVPSEARTGILGHELVHVCDYVRLSTFGLLWLAIRYLFPRFRRRYERQTDLGTIEHGLGKQLLAFTEFIDQHSGISPVYKTYLNRYYLNSKEIKTYLNL